MRKPRKKKPAGYQMTLYVTGTTPKSIYAITYIKAICEQYLKGHYRLEVVDIYQRPEEASRQQLLAAPTLVKRIPLPVRRLVGDMTNTDRVLKGLDLTPSSASAA